MKKLLIMLMISTAVFAKAFTLSVGIENSGTFSDSYETSSNPRLDLELLNHNKKFGFGIATGLNYINIDTLNYLITTNISLNTALNIIENDVYKVYLGLNVGYPYAFLTNYHPDSDLESIHPKFFYEVKFGTYYNDFNFNLGLSSIYVDKVYLKKTSSGVINRFSVSAGFLAF